jgi:catechol 2,3-dioxygenase-like lactoylglutathione lyase family enzyme
MKVTGISWLGLSIDNRETTVAFFRDILGSKLLGVFGDGSAKFQIGDHQIVELFEPGSDGAEIIDAPIVGFEVDDIDIARAELQDAGVELIGDLGAKHGYRWQFFKVPGAAVLALKMTPSELV